MLIVYMLVLCTLQYQLSSVEGHEGERELSSRDVNAAGEYFPTPRIRHAKSHHSNGGMHQSHHKGTKRKEEVRKVRVITAYVFIYWTLYIAHIVVKCIPMGYSF
jgi:hypothetical protein